MTSKEKAKKLVDKYMSKCVFMEIYWAKQCALICVDEIRKVNTFSIVDRYWQEVKQEINKICLD